MSDLMLNENSQMETDCVDFEIIKEKIIKTDEVIQMYRDVQIELKKLKPEHQDLQKKYFQSVSDATRLQLENDRNIHLYTTNKEKLDHLEQTYTQLYESHEKLKVENHVEVNNIQLKYQNVSNELSDCKQKLNQFEVTETTSPIQSYNLEKKTKKEKNCANSVLTKNKIKEEEGRLIADIDIAALKEKITSLNNSLECVKTSSKMDQCKLIMENKKLKESLAAKEAKINEINEDLQYFTLELTDKTSQLEKIKSYHSLEMATALEEKDIIIRQLQSKFDQFKLIDIKSNSELMEKNYECGANECKGLQKSSETGVDTAFEGIQCHSGSPGLPNIPESDIKGYKQKLKQCEVPETTSPIQRLQISSKTGVETAFEGIQCHSGSPGLPNIPESNIKDCKQKFKQCVVTETTSPIQGLQKNCKTGVETAFAGIQCHSGSPGLPNIPETDIKNCEGLKSIVLETTLEEIQSHSERPELPNILKIGQKDCENLQKPSESGSETVLEKIQCYPERSEVPKIHKRIPKDCEELQKTSKAAIETILGENWSNPESPGLPSFEDSDCESVSRILIEMKMPQLLLPMETDIEYSEPGKLDLPPTIKPSNKTSLTIPEIIISPPQYFPEIDDAQAMQNEIENVSNEARYKKIRDHKRKYFQNKIKLLKAKNMLILRKRDMLLQNKSVPTFAENEVLNAVRVLNNLQNNNIIENDIFSYSDRSNSMTFRKLSCDSALCAQHHISVSSNDGKRSPDLLGFASINILPDNRRVIGGGIIDIKNTSDEILNTLANMVKEKLKKSPIKYNKLKAKIHRKGDDVMVSETDSALANDGSGDVLERNKMLLQKAKEEKMLMRDYDSESSLSINFKLGHERDIPESSAMITNGFSESKTVLIEKAKEKQNRFNQANESPNDMSNLDKRTCLRSQNKNLSAKSDGNLDKSGGSADILLLEKDAEAEYVNNKRPTDVACLSEHNLEQTSLVTRRSKSPFVKIKSPLPRQNAIVSKYNLRKPSVHDLVRPPNRMSKICRDAPAENEDVEVENSNHSRSITQSSNDKPSPDSGYSENLSDTSESSRSLINSDLGANSHCVSEMSCNMVEGTKKRKIIETDGSIPIKKSKNAQPIEIERSVNNEENTMSVNEEVPITRIKHRKAHNLRPRRDSFPFVRNDLKPEHTTHFSQKVFGNNLNSITKCDEARLSRMKHGKTRNLRKRSDSLPASKFNVTSEETNHLIESLICDETAVTLNQIHVPKDTNPSRECKNAKPIEKLEIKVKTQRTGGFKKPNISRIIPSCPRSPDPCDIEFPVEEPPIIPLEKPGKMELTKAAVLFRKLITYSQETKVLDELVKLFRVQDSDYIAKLVLEQVSLDCDKPDTKFSPAPLMTETQRVLLGFMLRLERENVENVLDNFLKSAELRLFNTSTIQEIAPISQLYIAICKARRDITRVRKMICDALYFMGDLAIPFIFNILRSWIEVLPLEKDSSSYPLIKVIIQVVHLKVCVTPGYNLRPLRDLLHKYYGYPNERWNSDEIFEELLDQYLKKPVRSYDYPLLIYCKNHPSKWVHGKLEQKLQPIVDKITNDNFKATVIIFIGNVARQFSKVEDLEFLNSIKNWLRSLNTDTTPVLVKRSIFLCLRRLPKMKKSTKQIQQGAK